MGPRVERPGSDPEVRGHDCCMSGKVGGQLRGLDPPGGMEMVERLPCVARKADGSQQHAAGPL